MGPPMPSMTHSNGSSSGNGETAELGGSNGGGPSRDADVYERAGRGHFMPLWEGSHLDRREFVRLALQALGDMGYRLVSLSSGAVSC